MSMISFLNKNGTLIKAPLTMFFIREKSNYEKDILFIIRFSTLFNADNSSDDATPSAKAQAQNLKN